MGDGAYLFDPRGNLRAWSIYPTGAEGVGRRLPALGREAVLAPILLLVGAVAQIRRGR